MILASVCMRAGSKGVVNKNSRILLGRPLMEYTFDCVAGSCKVDEVSVSTDSDNIIEISKKNGIQHIFKRSKNLATDESSKWDVFKDLVLRFENKTGRNVEYLVDLDVTVPRRLSSHIDSSIELMLEKQTDVVITGYEPERNPYFNMMEVDNQGVAKLVKQTEKTIVCRQDAPIVYSLTPAVYVIKRSALFSYEHWSDAECMINPIPREFAVDIDTNLDFRIVECLMRQKEKA